MTTTEIPLKPFQIGKLQAEFGGPAESPRDVLERARVTLAPRGAWQKGTTRGESHEGHTRCLIQAMRDVDGVHVGVAEQFVLKAAKEITGTMYTSIPNFNDAPSTKKHHVLAALDRAIEMA